MSNWDELLEEFRALGGTAKNIRLGQGRLGRGIFPIDSAKPIAIRIPANLLVPCKDIVFANGVPRIGPTATTSARGKAWLNRYLEEFAWGYGGVDEIRRMFEMAGALPAELRHLLLTKYKCGSWFAEPKDELIQQLFFTTRVIMYRNQPVMMPIIELVNHGEGPRYDLYSEGIALRGIFPGEVYVQYSELDSFDYFLSWGFATPRPTAFSIGLTEAVGSVRMDVRQGFNVFSVSSERAWIPDIFRKKYSITLSFLMIGNACVPDLPRGIFYRLLRNAGYTGFEEAFDRVRHLNRLHFLGLIEELEGFDLPIARTLKAMARHQLRAISDCVGVREI